MRDALRRSRRIASTGGVVANLARIRPVVFCPGWKLVRVN
jgi:fatty acid-binding protein DegV